ncbi:MAG: tRNA (adenosine(37)-N6)-threonylcarbamoyltransferase complex dimerization subunit type 1 TsaB [Planctomycetaceae bacterium]|nr:tRNA (adenosine(37)-N6)-threonylcarbamoyltransferase complex dimerization subunit type 1 TsaB [Planctomycetaceae bacterium]
MKLLAIETSGLVGSIAYCQDGRLREEKVLTAAGRRHAQTLVQEVSDLLSRHQLNPSDVDAVAVSAGPGSFTGLRVGIVFAKTFAWANSAVLTAVDTHQAAAEQLTDVPQTSTIRVISDAQRNEVFVSDYRRLNEAKRSTLMSPLRIEPIAQIAAASDRDCPELIVTGPGLAKFADHFSDFTKRAEDSLWSPRAGAVALIGYQQVLDGNPADVDLLEPIYVRRSYAEEKRV